MDYEDDALMLMLVRMIEGEVECCCCCCHWVLPLYQALPESQMLAWYQRGRRRRDEWETVEVTSIPALLVNQHDVVVDLAEEELMLVPAPADAAAVMIHSEVESETPETLINVVK